MAIGLSSNPENILAKDRQVLVGPPPDSSPGSGSSTPTVPTVPTDTLGDLTPTKGNLVVGNGSIWTILAVGADDYVLIADTAEAVGMRWGPVVVPAVVVVTFDERDLWTYGIDDAFNQDSDMRDIYTFGEE